MLNLIWVYDEYKKDFSALDHINIVKQSLDFKNELFEVNI